MFRGTLRPLLWYVYILYTETIFIKKRFFGKAKLGLPGTYIVTLSDELQTPF